MPNKLKRALALAAKVASGVAVVLSLAILASVYQLAQETGVLQALLPVWRASIILQAHYVDPIDSNLATQRLLAGLINNLDPHSAYLPPVDLARFNADMRGSYGGIGIDHQADADEASLRVRDVMAKGPADIAGLRVGDKIVSINGESVATRSLEDNFEKIRGEVGTFVELEVEGSENSKKRLLKVKRAAIDVPTARWGLIDAPAGKIFWLRARQFNEELMPQTIAAIASAHKEADGKIVGIILDLRNNPGGLITSAVGLAALFGEPGALVVSSRERAPQAELRWRAEPGDWGYGHQVRGPDAIVVARAVAPWLRKAPMAILVNRRSASASEIVAGALKDWKRAVVVGNKTFGKGSVQNIIPLGEAEGAIKITTGRYYTPLGKAIQAVGVPVDIEVHTSLDQGLREADLPNHLPAEAGLAAENKGRGDDGRDPDPEPPSPLPAGAGSSADPVKPPPEPFLSVFKAKLSPPLSDPYIAAGIKAVRP